MYYLSARTWTVAKIERPKHLHRVWWEKRILRNSANNLVRTLRCYRGCFLQFFCWNSPKIHWTQKMKEMLVKYEYLGTSDRWTVSVLLSMNPWYKWLPLNSAIFVIALFLKYELNAVLTLISKLCCSKK